MAEKPSYLGLLNAIAVAEAEAECYLQAWASVTPRDDVRGVLQTIALREGEHGKAFAKRICELGYSVVPKEDPKAAERMRIACATDMSDREKFEALGLGRPVEGDDIFTGMFKDQTIDIWTGQLLGRYIAEERDSGRMFRACYGQLVAEEAECCVEPSAATVEERLDRIERMLEKLISA